MPVAEITVESIFAAAGVTHGYIVFYNTNTRFYVTRYMYADSILWQDYMVPVRLRVMGGGICVACGKDYTPACAEECTPRYIYCATCANPCWIEDTNEVSHGNDRVLVCPACVGDTRDCASCGCEVHNAFTNVVVTGDHVCTSCIYDYYFTCEQCDDIIPLEDNYNDLCETCYEESREDEDDAGIHDYSYKPYPQFQATNAERWPTLLGMPGELYIGMELETEMRSGASLALAASRVLNEVNEDADLVYLKYDSSLNHGFEIVSHPFTFTYWMSKFPFEQLKQEGVQSFRHKTTGNHFHLSKNAFTPWHLYKFLRFHYDNRQFIEEIAQRSSNTWASFNRVAKDTMKAQAKVHGKSRSKNKPHGDVYAASVDRYVAVNLQNEKTVELRYFKGNLKPAAIKKNLQFIHAAFWFSKLYGLSDMNVEAFLSFIRADKKLYRELNSYTEAC